MAANSSVSRGLAHFGKRFAHQLSARDLPAASLSPYLAGFRRNVHASVYDKNVDEHVRPAVVPDEVIEQQSEKYWAPNPKTGVFAPANSEACSADSKVHSGLAGNAPAESEWVLEQKAYIRPLEDLEKPQNP